MMIASIHKIPKRWRELFALIPGYDPIETAGECHFNAKVADACCAFFENELVHIEGDMAGKPLKLEPWQQATVGCAFGWFRPNGKRRYREVFEYVPRKNGKTTKTAGLVCLMAYCDREPGAQIYSAAAAQKQSELVFRGTEHMIRHNPRLAANAKILATPKRIKFFGGASYYAALAADAGPLHGLNSHFIIVDEVHSLPNRDLVDVLMTSTANKSQPLVWFITTADYDRESICNEKYEYACQVRDGIIEDPAFLPVVYEALPEDDWHDPAVWKKANPNLGVSVSEEYFRRECKRADDQPSYTNTFLRLHLNIRTTNDQKFFDMPQWDACSGAVNLESLKGRTCYLGLDLSSTTDLTCLSMIFPPIGEGDKWKVHPIFWVPSENAKKREASDHVPYPQWIAEGLIKTTPGKTIDYEYIRKEINHLAKDYAIRHVFIDPWNATQLMLQLSQDGFEVVKFQQSHANYTGPTRELEKIIIAGMLEHGGNKVLRWNAQNTAIETNAMEQVRPSKRKSTERIDGIVATIIGIAGALSDKDAGPSIYETRGLIEV